MSASFMLFVFNFFPRDLFYKKICEICAYRFPQKSRESENNDTILSPKLLRIDFARIAAKVCTNKLKQKDFEKIVLKQID